MTPAELAAIEARHADCSTMRPCDAATLLAALRTEQEARKRVEAAALFGPQGVSFPNLPHHPTGPDVLDAVAAYMDRQDDCDPNPYASRQVQRHLREWATRLRAALAPDASEGGERE